MDTSPRSLTTTPSQILSNNFSPINIPSPSLSTSTATTPETMSSDSNSSTTTSQSPNEIGNFQGSPVSIAHENHALPLSIRNRILSATPGTAAFNTATQRGGVHPERAQELGYLAASLAAAEQRRNPPPLENIPRVMQIQNRDRETTRILAQRHLRQKSSFFAPQPSPKRTD